MFRRIFIGLTLAVVANSASAYFYNGNDLREPLKEYRKAEREDPNTDYTQAWNFRGYVYGVYDATDSEYCTPRDFGGHQLMAVVAKYIEDNPQLWSKPADELVGSAIKAAFPCD
ncbi:hypothetical protein EJ063_19555 [Vibrio aquaticus]|uniref:Rap1a immunity protein domain-containing protein n=1 Tax=Vibrio aquaticus TaxID=2496559 RepID=A0A3S0MG43_9VIBR|nr:Rap1a/Tai family immunity protein [Vibrio aquaticus]RTZ13605.1 hypothetical protein EJ063_19555 [Vibrio aquaticus]